MAETIHDNDIGASWERWNCLVEVACMAYEEEKGKAAETSNNVQDYNLLVPKLPFSIKRNRSTRIARTYKPIHEEGETSQSPNPRMAITYETIVKRKQECDQKSKKISFIFKSTYREVGESSKSSNLGKKRRMDFCEDDIIEGTDQKPKKVSFIKSTYKEVGESSKSSNLGKKRRMDFCEEEEEDDDIYIEEKKKAKKVVKPQPTVTNKPPLRNLRQDFKDHIRAIGGNLDSLVCVIEKRLYQSDVTKGLGRLSVPYNQVENKFLEESEMEHLDIPMAEIVASLVQPSLQECEITLRNWNTNNQYVLVKPWNQVVLTNRLEEGMVIQLWSFRRDSKLCFALVPIV